MILSSIPCLLSSRYFLQRIGSSDKVQGELSARKFVEIFGKAEVSYFPL